MNREQAVRFLLEHPAKFANALGFDKLGVFVLKCGTPYGIIKRKGECQT